MKMNVFKMFKLMCVMLGLSLKISASSIGTQFQYYYESTTRLYDFSDFNNKKINDIEQELETERQARTQCPAQMRIQRIGEFKTSKKIDVDLQKIVVTISALFRCGEFQPDFSEGQINCDVRNNNKCPEGYQCKISWDLPFVCVKK